MFIKQGTGTPYMCFEHSSMPRLSLVLVHRQLVFTTLHNSLRICEMPERSPTLHRIFGVANSSEPRSRIPVSDENTCQQ